MLALLPFLPIPAIFPLPGTCRFGNGGRLQHSFLSHVFCEVFHEILLAKCVQNIIAGHDVACQDARLLQATVLMFNRRERLPIQYVTKSILLTLYIPMSSFLKFLYILKSQQVVDINFQRIGNSHQVAQVGL